MVTSERPRVTAVVLSHNGLATLPAVLNAVRSQTERLSEVIVVDNGSTDGTREFLLSQATSGIRSILLDANQGVGRGHNVGWQSALKDDQCELIWSLEHDTIPDPDCLEHLLRALSALKHQALAPRIGGLTTLQLAPYLTDPLPSYIWRRGRFWRLPRIENHPPTFLDSRFTFNGTLFLARAIRAVGMLREDFFVGYEDYEYRGRMQAAGLVFVRVNAARVRHDLFKSHPVKTLFGRRWYLPGGNNPVRTYYATRNSVYLDSLRPGRTRLVFVLATLGKLCGSVLYSALLGPDRAKKARARVSGVIDGLSGKLGRNDELFR